MIVQDFISAAYNQLTQKWATMLIGDDWLLAYINFALADIYSYEWREWAFMYNTEKVIVWNLVDTTIITTMDKPIIKLLACRDLWDTDYKEVQFRIKHWLSLRENWDAYFNPFGTILKLYNNITSPINYSIDRIWWFNAVQTKTETLPIPDAFCWALFDFTMAYCMPQFWQYWDNKELNYYTKARNKLAELAKVSSYQVKQLNPNIR